MRPNLPASDSGWVTTRANCRSSGLPCCFLYGLHRLPNRKRPWREAENFCEPIASVWPHRRWPSRRDRVRIATGKTRGKQPSGRFASWRDAVKAPCAFFLARGPQPTPCEPPASVYPTAGGGLPIIKWKRRTIKTVKNRALNPHEHEPTQTGKFSPKTGTPPTPFHDLYENKALSCFSFLHTKITKELRIPSRRRNRQFAPFLGLFRVYSIRSDRLLRREFGPQKQRGHPRKPGCPRSLLH